MTLSEEFLAAAQRARAAAVRLRAVDTATKNAALRAIAAQLDADRDAIVAANDADVTAARDAGTPAGLIDRLTLSHDRLTAIVDAIGTVVELADPVGEVIRGYRLPNGLRVEQVRVPMGVVGMIYEARPNVTVDAAALCLKSGNAALLRGSASARRTNAALIASMRTALDSVGVPADAIQAVPGTGHDSVAELITARGLVDVVIPRGGAGLINRVVREATVPVIETGVGNCHVYVDAAADPDDAVAITVNSKVHRPSVCNAAETLLVHRGVAATLLPRIGAALVAEGVTLHADDTAARVLSDAGIPSQPATEHDWETEYLSLDLAVGVVEDVTGAVEHIRRWSTGHTEAIVSDSAAAIAAFTAGVDAAAVAVNASTRFTDGGEFGFGAEIGISTQKLHARGPMALPELTTTTFVVTGSGQIRS